MTDLRQAAQQALEALEGWEHCDEWVWPVSALEQSKRNTTESLAALRTALEQQAEPVAHVLFRQDDDGLEPIMFYSPKTAPDPRTLKDRFVLKDVWLSPPPQRPWVGLTDDEILSTDPWEILRADPWMGTSDSNINPYQILLKVRTLEAKLKERNT